MTDRHSVELRYLAPDDWPLWRAVRLQALADAPHAFAARLADWQGEGDRPKRWRARLEAVPLHIIASVAGDHVGQISVNALDADGDAELMSLWVAPSARGRGVGDALVEAAVEWARERSARRIVLRVRASNDRAIRAYERNQFAFTDRAVENDELEMARSF